MVKFEVSMSTGYENMKGENGSGFR